MTQLTSETNPPHLVVVGAGIVGLGHAVAALDAGYRVTVLEQDARAVLASVRNFGHVGASVQSGELAELARAALPIWESLVERAGVTARRSGTLAVARSEAEEAVLHDLVERQAATETDAAVDTAVGDIVAGEMQTGRRTAELLRIPEGNPAAAAIRAGLLLPADITADPRTAVARIAAWVDQHERGDVRFGVTVRSVTGATSEGGSCIVDTNHGPVTGDRVVVAAGHLVGRLFPAAATSAAVSECALQMARVRAPRPMELGAAGCAPAVLTGTSMLRYGAFQGEATAALRREIGTERPDLLEIDANVMFTQQADGTLLVGDSHERHDTAEPFLNEAWSATLLDEVARLLGVRELEVLERWQGLYATSPAQDILDFEPEPGIHVVTMTTGTGMTVGLGLGARTIAAITPYFV